MPKSNLLVVAGALAVATVLTILGIDMLTPASSSEEELIEDDEGNEMTIQRRIVDVVVMQCAPWGEGQPSTVPIVVIAYSNSTNAPFFPFGTSCAQALSDLVSNDFDIWTGKRGESNDGGEFYTLLRHRYVN